MYAIHEIHTMYDYNGLESYFVSFRGISCPFSGYSVTSFGFLGGPGDNVFD